MGFRSRLSRAIDELRGATPTPAAEPRETRSAPRDVPLVPRTSMPSRRNLRSHFRAAAYTRTLSDWPTSLESPDDIVRADMRVLRARAREMDQSDPLTGMYGEQLISNVLGAGGMEHKAQVLIPGTDQLAEQVNKTIDAAWDDWWNDEITTDGLMNGDMFERLQLRNTPVDGETFTRRLMGPDFRHGLALQSIDADLVDDRYNWRRDGQNNEIRMGIEIDRLGRRIRYHVKDEAAYAPGSDGRGRYPIEARDLRHHFLPLRVNQTRGVTWFTRAMLLQNHSQRSLEAAAIGWRMGANQGGFIEWADESLATPLPEEGGAGSETTGAAGGGTSATGGQGSALAPEIVMEPAQFIELAPGQKMSQFKPQYPNGDTPDFLKMFDQRFAASVGAMYYQLTGDLEATSWSSMRGGEVTMQELWRIKQAFWRWSFRRCIYDWWLESAILAGTLKLPTMNWRDYRRVKFSPKGWDSVDQQKEQAANEAKLKNRLTSRTRICAEKNLDWEADVLPELTREEELLKAAGLVPEPPPATDAKPNDDPPADDSDDAGDETNGNGNGNGTAKRALTNRILAARH